VKETYTPLNVEPANIWNYKQNYPSLVVEDIIEVFNLQSDPQAKEKIEKILMARGVNKWLKCRKDIIRLKHAWLKRINKTIQEQIDLKKEPTNIKKINKRFKNRGVLEALNTCRQEVRNICHSPRWVLEEEIR
jgi:DNA mismatch repair ATPase MutS